jgi:DNA-binding response OmpR family regulator
MSRTRIAVASRSPGERAAFVEWLDGAGYHALSVANPAAPPREVEALNFEMLIIEADLMTVGSLMHVARYRPSPRPVIVVGDADVEAEVEAERRGASYLVRPVERSSLLFAVTLALAEGRPMRRSPRKPLARMPAAVDGMTSRVVDVSYEGVRVELPAKERDALPPQFTLKVPLFDVAVLVHRVWMCAGTTPQSPGMLWVGGALERNPQKSELAWRTLVEQAPAALTA